MSTHAGTPSKPHGSSDLSPQRLCMMARVSPSHSVPIGALSPPPIAVRHTTAAGDTMSGGIPTVPGGIFRLVGVPAESRVAHIRTVFHVTTHSRVRRITGLSGPSGYSEYPMCTLGRWAAFPRCSVVQRSHRRPIRAPARPPWPLRSRPPMRVSAPCYCSRLYLEYPREH